VALPQSYAWAAPILVDEFDTCAAQGTLNRLNCRRRNLPPLLAASWAGWLAAGLHRTSRSAMPARATTVLSLAVTFAGRVGEAFAFAPTTRCCTPLAGCTTATCFAIAHLSSTAKSVRLKCSAVPKGRHAASSSNGEDFRRSPVGDSWKEENGTSFLKSIEECARGSGLTRDGGCQRFDSMRATTGPELRNWRSFEL
jgi:hypothetical protein